MLPRDALESRAQTHRLSSSNAAIRTPSHTQTVAQLQMAGGTIGVTEVAVVSFYMAAGVASAKQG